MRPLSLILPLLAAAAALVVPAVADDGWMSEEAMKAAFANKTIQGLYATGKAFTETYGADGGISYREKSVDYHGHWSLQAGTFCTIYDADAAGGCFQVKQVSDNCYEFYFVARTEAEAAQFGPGVPSWTARAAVSDRDASCSDKPAV